MSRLAVTDEEPEREVAICPRCGVPLLHPSFCLTCQMYRRQAEEAQKTKDWVSRMVNELFLEVHGGGRKNDQSR
jgi:hypothetical protein